VDGVTILLFVGRYFAEEEGAERGECWLSLRRASSGVQFRSLSLHGPTPEVTRGENVILRFADCLNN